MLTKEGTTHRIDRQVHYQISRECSLGLQFSAIWNLCIHTEGASEPASKTLSLLRHLAASTSPVLCIVSRVDIVCGKMSPR